MAVSKKTESVIKNEVNTVEQETPKQIKQKVQAKKFEPSDTITCRSVCYGELILEGYKTKMLYTWANAGDTAEVEYQDLQALQSRKSRFLTDPLFIIEDEDLVKQWSNMLNPIYEKIDEEDLEQMLKLPAAKLKSKLKSSPDGVKESIKSLAAAKISTGEFDSIARIKAIDEVLGTELVNSIG